MAGYELGPRNCAVNIIQADMFQDDTGSQQQQQQLIVQVAGNTAPFLIKKERKMDASLPGYSHVQTATLAAPRPKRARAAQIVEIVTQSPRCRPTMMKPPCPDGYRPIPVEQATGWLRGAGGVEGRDRANDIIYSAAPWHQKCDLLPAGPSSHSAWYIFVCTDLESRC